MAEYVHLFGAEDVRQAGYSIQNAADQMKLVQGWQSERLDMHERFMTDWIERFEQAVDSLIEAMTDSRGPDVAIVADRVSDGSLESIQEAK